MSLVHDYNDAALKTADAAAVATLFGYFFNVLPQATLLATFVWAIFRAWAEWENIRLKREQRRNAERNYGRRADD
jgi:hypothetical protein